MDNKFSRGKFSYLSPTCSLILSHYICSDFDVLEVLSRGQNPQHWHLSRRGLGTGKEGSVLNGEVFMEIARKESTLSDVDNELVGIVKRFVE